MLLHDDGYELTAAHLDDLGLTSVIRTPIRGRSHEIGTFTLARKTAPFRREEEVLVQMLAERVAIALEAHEQREELEGFRALAEHSTDFIAVATPGGEVSYVNAAGRALIGFIGGDLRGRTVSDLWQSIDAATLREASPGLLAEGKVFQLRGRLRHFGGGEPVDVAGQAFGIPGSRQGELLAVACIVRDLGPVRQAEARHAELVRQVFVSHEQMQLLFEALPQIVWTARADGFVDYFNQRWTEYTGLTRDQMRRFTWRRIVHPEDVSKVMAAWRHAVKTGAAYEIEYRFRRAADGAYRWHLGRALPLRDDTGRIVKWFGTCTDIHEQKRANDDLQHAVKMRENFISVASHELRTPLTALRLMTETLARSTRAGTATAEHVHDRTTRIDRQVTHLIQLVENLLDVSRLTAGRLPLEFSDVDLAAVTRDVVESLQAEVSHSGCTLTLEAPVAVVGRWDALRVEQVVTNVIGNALKYGAHKPIEVSVIDEGDAGGFRVRDHGIGIARDQQQHIFERFERVASERHFVGFGLGLWIAREIVQALGGTIVVESSPGQGSTFLVRLPKQPR